jgi:hypothetical protein
MVLVEAKYIVEVLVTFGTKAGVPLAAFGKGGDSLKGIDDNHMWCQIIHVGASTEAIAPSTPIRTCSDLIDSARDVCKTNKEKPCVDAYMIPTAISHYFAYVSSPQPDDPIEGGTLDYRDFVYSLKLGEVSANHRIAPVAGFDVGQGFLFRTVNTRDDVEVRNAFPITLFAALGWDWYLAERTQASQAFTLRDMIQVPSIDMQFGACGKLEDVGNGVTRRYRWAYGTRFEQGFSLLTLHLSLGWEPTLHEPIRTSRQFAVETGISFAVNGRRLASDVSSFFGGIGRSLHITQ